MFKVGEYTPESEFKELALLLERRPIPTNYCRKNSGLGRSQTFGIVKQRSYRYAGSRMNWARPDLFAAIARLARKILPYDFEYDAIQVNQNYLTMPHKDAGNRGESAIVGFGNYTGGELLVEEQPVSIKHRVVYFDGSMYTHHTAPFTGTRYSLVFFKVDRMFKKKPEYTAVETNKGMMISEMLDGVERIYTQKGDIFWTSDGHVPERRKARPTLREAIE